MANTLEGQLCETRDDILALIRVTVDVYRVAELANAESAITGLMQEVVLFNVRSGGSEYKDEVLANECQHASSTIKNAIMGLDSLDKAITSLGKVRDLIDKSAKKMAFASLPGSVDDSGDSGQ